jgi:hypothetical protein
MLKENADSEWREVNGNVNEKPILLELKNMVGQGEEAKRPFSGIRTMGTMGKCQLENGRRWGMEIRRME